MRVRLGAGLCAASCSFAVLVSASLAAGSERAGSSLANGAVAADCSKATALEAVTRLHLNDPGVTNPVITVLCGSFTGPGSQTMVASLFGPGNTGMIDWVVFRWDGNAWQFVMKQHQAATLSAAGSDIRETVSIFRANDPRCCPSGGKKSRIWHWNGTRLVAGPWKQATPPKPGGKSLHLPEFRSPTHNIMCDIVDDDRAYCASRNRPQSVGLTSDGVVRICHGLTCVYGPPPYDKKPFPSSVPVLAYGTQDVTSLYRCKSATTGITCTVAVRGRAYGKGFLINSAGVRRIGP